jgi:hypothetical protein
MGVYRLGLLVFSSEKAAVEEVERAAEGWRGEKSNGNRGMASFFIFIFWPDFLHGQAIKSTHIYRG